MMSIENRSLQFFIIEVSQMNEGMQYFHTSPPVPATYFLTMYILPWSWVNAFALPHVGSAYPSSIYMVEE